MKPEEYRKVMKIEEGSDLWYTVKGEVGTHTLKELKRFQTDRMLHKKPFNKRVATMNIIEELFELWGVNDDKENRTLATDVTNSIIAHVELVRLYAPTKERAENQNMDVITYDEPTVHDEIDALCDIQVFAGGDILKLGYDNEQCLVEAGKEINSREGEIIEGKFQKYKTPEAKAKWYKADFSGCKL